MSKTSINFSEKLKCLRIASGLTQKDLAKQLNISRSCLANYEAGKRFPDEEIMLIIANHFKVSSDYLYGNSFPERVDKAQADTVYAMKKLSDNGHLDLTKVSPSSKIALVEFYNFLEEKSNNHKAIL